MVSGPRFAAALAELEPAWASPSARAVAEAGWTEATTRWPGVTLPPEALAEHLVERVRSPRTPDDLERAEIADLYLACACAAGDDDALAAFERRFDDAIGSAARGAPEARRAELRQLLRHKLFVGPTAKIGEYLGRGSLEGWVRVTARRTHLDLTRGIERRRDAPAADETLMDRAAGEDLELEFLKGHYRREFRAAFGEAMQALTPRDRNVLRQHLIHRLSIDEIGAIYDVHRATGARWVQRARGALLAGTRGRMRDRLRIEEDELDSIMRLIDSRLEVSVARVLGPEDEQQA